MKQIKRLIRLKSISDRFIINTIFKYGLPSFLPGLWLGGFDSIKKATVKGNYFAIKNDIDTASSILTNIVLKDPKSKNAVISLGCLLSQTSWTGYDHVWKKLSKSWTMIDKPEKIDQEIFPFFALGVELALVFDPDRAKKAIHDIYYPFIWKFERCDKKDNDPIFYWHVPKTGGTSVNSKLSKIWYRSGTQFLPSYTTRRFLSYVIEFHDGVLPYISSAHISSKNIPHSAIEDYRKLLVLRDPKDRALSAWRQYRENPAQRLLILPQHGFLWDYFPVREFSDWLRTAPSSVVNPLSWTFSEYLPSNLSAAVDDVIQIEHLDSFGVKLLDSLSVERKINNFRVMKNVTNKSICEDNVNMNDIKNFLAPDYEVYERLKVLSES